MDYKETIKERLNILSPELRAFVLDENWRRGTEKIGKQFSLSEEKYTLFENEVFLVLLCFEPKSDFAENIKRELEIDSNMAGWVAEDVNKNIFKQVSDEINAMWQTGGQAEGPEQSEGKNQTQNNIGNSFEQIILNQAKAMQPARPADETGRVTKYEVRGTNTKEEKPENLPTGDNEQKAIHNYIGESDPYRESIE
jgi:hypothetical protein